MSCPLHRITHRAVFRNQKAGKRGPANKPAQAPAKAKQTTLNFAPSGTASGRTSTRAAAGRARGKMAETVSLYCVKELNTKHSYIRTIRLKLIATSFCSLERSRVVIITVQYVRSMKVRVGFSIKYNCPCDLKFGIMLARRLSTNVRG